MNFDNSAKCDFSLFKDDESSNCGVESLRKTAAASWLCVPNLSLNHRSKGSVIFGGKHAHQAGRASTKLRVGRAILRSGGKENP